MRKYCFNHIPQYLQLVKSSECLLDPLMVMEQISWNSNSSWRALDKKEHLEWSLFIALEDTFH